MNIKSDQNRVIQKKLHEFPSVPSPIGIFSEDSYINRELSQLSFFERVLALAADTETPLLERMRFLTICSTILDEFFEIRVAGLKERLRVGLDRIGPDGLSAREVLDQIHKRVKSLVKRQYQLLNHQVLPSLEAQDIVILKRLEWRKKQQDWVQKYFQDQVVPVLTPIVLDPSHPFPQILNKSLNMFIELKGTDAFGRTCEYAVLPVPRCLPRVIEIPSEARVNPNRSEFVLLSSVIHASIAEVFPGMKVDRCHQFRVTRNADLWVDEEEVEDLLDALKGELPGRRYGEVVRLEVDDRCPEEHVQFLIDHFSLTEDDLYRVNGAVNLHRLGAVVSVADRPDLKYPVFAPSLPVRSNDYFELLNKRDLLLHHPFESFSPIVDLIKQAAMDPDVLAIKQTVYRTGRDSPIIDALIEAARNGKEVAAIVELRARFDEAANIETASRLQDAGAHVVYGVVGVKTHAKLLLIIRKEGQKIRRYVHLGTGNYHAGTARAYTDFSLMTSDEKICTDVHNIFQQLTSVGYLHDYNDLMQSPFTFADTISQLIEYEINEVKEGREGRIIIKINSISDPAMIERLYLASQSGVQIDLIVRGICCLKPGIPNVSENIRVRSILGRFLEHTRIYYFNHGGEEKLYLSSADLMQRNLYRRVEVAFPVKAMELKQRVLQEGLEMYLDQGHGSWHLNNNGSYECLSSEEGELHRDAQTRLLHQLAEL